MSRPSSMVQRPLTLTEELEKLEQSITLTLQEIDHNFSQAHRIVTTSILPLVEQYSENSRDVWEGAKFWKQFFEASANVSLSGYEEKPEDTETTVQDEDDEHTATTVEGQETDESNVTQSQLADNNPDESGLDEGSASHHKPDDLDDLTELDVSSHSTPRAPAPQEKPGDNAEAYSPSGTSPYETLKKQIHESDSPFDVDKDMDESTNLPTTPQPGKSKPSFRQYQGATPGSPTSSPFVPPVSHEKKPRSGYGHSSKPSDPVMHRMPDKTYRVQATPLKGHHITPKPNTSARKYPLDDSPLSSPEPEAPKLHEEIFSSPIKGLETPGTGRKRRFLHGGTPGRAGGTPATGGLRTPQPGTSVLTPAKGKAKQWDSDDDDDEILGGGGGGGGGGGDDFTDDGFSPPKTMQFHIPQSRLMKTPAKEASKKIVEDLLVTAGAGDDITDSVGEQSPSLIRRADGLEDESF